MELKMMQHNIRSIKSNKDMLEQHLLINDIDIALLGEIWLKPEENIHIKDYTFNSTKRADGYGGVAILIKKNIKHKLINNNNKFDPIEIAEIETTNLKKNLTLVSIYIPPNINIKLLKKKFNELITNYNNKTNVIIAGDVNAHNELWEMDSINNRAGETIAQIVLDSNFIVLNTGEHTYNSTRYNNTSAIDLTIVHNTIANDVFWEKTYENLSSDHFISNIQMLNNKNINQTNRTYVNYKKVQQQVEIMEIDDIINITQYEDKIKHIVENNTKTTSNNNRYMPKYWWTEKINKLWIIKRNKLRTYNNINSDYTKEELRKSTINLKKEIRKTKKEKFLKFAEEINPKTNIKSIYDKINMFNEKKKKKSNCNLDDNDLVNFLNHNFEKTNNDNLSKKKTDTCKNIETITIEEIKGIIKKNKNTAPGHNKLSNKMLKVLPENQIELITKCLNNILTCQEIPETWKRIVIVPILKPNKNPNDFTSYRPISLINVITKLFNKTIKKRLETYIEKNNLLSCNTFGFRKNRSCHQCLNNILNDLTKTQNNKKYKMLIVTDISRAFDNVNVDKLVTIMEKLKINQVYVNLIYNFLYNRRLEIKLANGEVHTRVVLSGLPQGSILSTLLFNIYTNELHQLSNGEANIYQFADDFSMVISANTVSELKNNTSNFIKKFNDKLKELNLKLNINKCNTIAFNCNNDFNHLLDIEIDNETIKNVNSVRVLGITIDKKLTFNLNTKICKESCNKYLNILKIFSRTRGGAHPKTMLSISNAVINSKLYYCTLLTNISDRNIEIIQKIQNQALRVCMGYIKSTPIETMLAESCTLPFYLLHEFNVAKYIIRQIQNDNIQLILDTNIKHLKNIYTKYIKLFELIPKNISNTDKINNLKIITNKYNYYNNNVIRNILNKNIEGNIGNGFFAIFTDGSKSKDKNGIGIHFGNTGEQFSYRLDIAVSIKTLEIMAIEIAIKLALLMKKEKIIVYTDSLSSLESIKKTIVENNNKYVENSIIKIIKEHKNTTVVLKWIPGHIGLKHHDLADISAKEGRSVYVPSFIEPNELRTNILNSIWDTRRSHYLLNTNVKGTKYRDIFNGRINRKPWFMNLVNAKSKEIKIINRLRAGHCFNKNTLRLMKLVDSNKCDICNVTENNQHLLFDCKKYDNIRIKYDVFKNLNFEQIICDIDNYRDILNYLDECEIYI